MSQDLSEYDEFTLWLALNQILGQGHTLFCQLLAKLCSQIYLFSPGSSQLGVIEIGEFLIPESNHSRLSIGFRLLFNQIAKLLEKSTDILVEVLITILTISPFGSLAQLGRNPV
jgi:hypothetical protein